MNDDLLKQIRDDLEFLLSFAPAKDPKKVEQGLAPMFYVTGSYAGDYALAERVQKICERYGIVEENPEDEDYADAE
jgi:hypothetical protein